ncbi:MULTISPECIES: hypothetical protein [Pseudomonas]|jgi:hypothetical protein|uniref:hypothetical protein n=1 Tax=Pseudomonas TaxID=286 RepID=UPI00025FF3B7|nr:MULTISPECIES: hypothetical protein [Pseudomonas]EIK64567.1 hypothetical protein PflQ8_2522 [Pseudomonas fluorescens Q8r1-96]KIR16306.1 hypothetical protein PFLU4_30050 [Pseudomonas fluorescens]ALQ03313.1 hypothetical protein AK973_2864 [Pseudomonas brassicacearum]AOS37903.1 hypothetical protein A0U95_03775 [Pseudomonas brassicacearum]KAB0528078.1 hypothetical protein F7R20_00740 [Pseudomonas brassicacearum subsp. brassicacearum]
MIDTTCTGNLRPDTSVATYQEHESGFLLPQLMGALASESAGFVSNDLCQQRAHGTLLAKAGALVMRVLKLTPIG